MQTKLVTVSPDRPVSELQEVLLRHRIHGAPVVERGRLVGIVSRSDIVRQLKLEEERIAASAFYLESFDADQQRVEDQERVIAASAIRVSKLVVRDVMIEDLISVGPDATLQQAAQTMLDRRVHRLLVTEGPELRGIITSLDLVRLFADGSATHA